MNRLIATLLILLASLPALAQDTRYCGPPARDADGAILRSRAVLREFQRVYPCPANGQPAGACPGWYKDHVVPLVCGGCDSLENLQWLPADLKTCRSALCKDRFERRVYCRFVLPPVEPATPADTTTPTITITITITPKDPTP